MNTQFFRKNLRMTTIITIMVLVSWIRLSRVPDLGYFMIDEERDAFLVRRLLVDHRPLLVGGVIPGGISIGPLFFYLSGIPYAISRLNPIGPAYAAGVVGVFGVFGVFVVGKSLLNNRVGLLAMVFSAFSLLNIIYHRPWWPLTFGQLVTLVAYLALFQLVRKRTQRSDLKRLQDQIFRNGWLWILIVVLIVGAQSDPSTLSLIPLSIIFLWMNRKNLAVKRKTIIAGICVFLLAHASLLIFEVRHDFQNTKAATRLFSGFTSSSLSISFSNFISVLEMTTGLLYRLFIPTGPLDVTKQISPCTEFLSMRRDGVWWPGAWGLLVLVGIYAISALLKGRTMAHAKVRPFQIARQLLSFHILIAFSGILTFTILQPGYIHEWLWSFMFPTFFLVIADLSIVVWKFTKLPSLRGMLLAILTIWILSNIYLFSRLTNVAGLGGKLRVVRAANREINDRPYELRSDGDPKTGSECFRFGGWRYLFTLHGNPPVKSYMDYVYEGWVYPSSGRDTQSVISVINPLDSSPRYTKMPAGL